MDTPENKFGVYSQSRVLLLGNYANSYNTHLLFHYPSSWWLLLLLLFMVVAAPPALFWLLSPVAWHYSFVKTNPCLKTEKSLAPTAILNTRFEDKYY